MGGSGNVALGSFPIGDFEIGNFEIGNFETGTIVATTPVPDDAGFLPIAVSTGTPSQQSSTQSVGNSARWTKLWEGTVAGQRNVIPIPLYRLEIYCETSPPNTYRLAGDWPATMQMTLPVPKKFMEYTETIASGRHRDFRRQIEVLEFRPVSPHEFFGQLAQKGLCIVIQLPTGQMLLLPCWEKRPKKMRGYLFPEDFFYCWHSVLQAMTKKPQNFSPLIDNREACYFHWLRTGSATKAISKRNRVTGPKRLKAGEERFVTTVAAQGQELLPGLPNEVTLYQIASKLPWRALHLLSSVSRDWRQAIGSRQVYESRVHQRLTEQLVVCNHTFKVSKFAKKAEVSQISLYSMKDSRFYDVPQLPHLGGIPKGCQSVSLDGKLYVLGGLKDKTSNLASNEVYVLDLAGQTRGQRRWRQCQDMRLPRQEFACGVIGGRIYVFGGTSVMEPLCESEVYDPTVNAWSPLSSMLSLRFRHSVTTVGDELVVHGGCSFEPKYSDWRERRFIVDRNRFVIDLDGTKLCKVDDAIHDYGGDYGGDGPIYIFQDGRVMDQDGDLIGNLSHYYTDALSLEIYHPEKDEWRMVKPFQKDSNAKFFVAHGKYYSMSQGGIHAYDIETASWTHLHSCSFPTIGPVCHVDPITVIALNDELLLAIVRWRKRSFPVFGSSLLQSKGFGSKLKEVVWEKAGQLELSFDSTLTNDTPFFVPIQL